MTVTYDERLRAAVIALRRRWFKRIDSCTAVFAVSEDALVRALRETR